MKKIRYAVIGLGHIAQSAILPAFKHARSNSELKVLISSDPVKLKILSKKYKVQANYTHKEFDACLENEEIDVLYIATPNTNHLMYAQKAAQKGIHVICEKPLATSLAECRALTQTVERTKIKFMVAYRLHFDPANLKVIELALSKKLGDLRIFNSLFSYPIKDKENIRLKQSKGGGPLADIGTYCINAARYLFRDEPTEVFAQTATAAKDDRFREVPEMVSVSMTFPDDRLATFVCSFGAAACARFDLLGTKGMVTLDSAYEYIEEMNLTTQIGDRTKTQKFPKHDQFAAELLYFSNCILKDQSPEPSLLEGLADVAVLQAIEQSIKLGRPAKVTAVEKPKRPTPILKITRPPVKKSDITHVNTKSPSGD